MGYEMEGHMNIIRATEFWHYAAVFYVRVDSATKYFNMSIERELTESDSLDAIYFLALDDIHPMATCRINILDKETVKIERVAVVTERQGQGIGRKLIEAVEDWIKSEGYKKVIINSREPVLGFYESLGYVPDHSTRVGNGIFSTIETEKTLTK